MSDCSFLVAGDVRGCFKKLFNKVKKLNEQKGPFSFLICVGSFFSKKDDEWKHYIQNARDIPLPVFILGPNREEEMEFYPPNIDNLHSINEHITYLGKSGVYATAEGLKIGFLSGIESLTNQLNDYNFSVTDANSLLKCLLESRKSPVVDVFISSVWPADVLNHTDFQYKPSHASKLLASIISKFKPWYHFVGLENMEYFRAPYFNRESSNEILNFTRFISLPNVESKYKWLYAVNMKLPKILDKNELTNISKTTPSPFLVYEESNGKIFNNYRYDLNQKSPLNPMLSKRKRTTQNRTCEDLVKKCWFCLSNPETKKHLILAIGSHVYVALSRGGLVQHHLHIIPIPHISSIRYSSSDVQADVLFFKELLKQFFLKSNKHIIWFERNYKSFHAAVDGIPLPGNLCLNLKDVLMEKANLLDFEFQSFGSPENLFSSIPPEKSYFHIDMPNGEQLILNITSKFPLNFGRDFLVDERLLNTPDRADWKDCIMSPEEEIEIATELRKMIGR